MGTRGAAAAEEEEEEAGLELVSVSVSVLVSVLVLVLVFFFHPLAPLPDFLLPPRLRGAAGPAIAASRARLAAFPPTRDGGGREAAAAAAAADGPPASSRRTGSGGSIVERGWGRGEGRRRGRGGRKGGASFVQRCVIRESFVPDVEGWMELLSHATAVDTFTKQVLANSY